MKLYEKGVFLVDGEKIVENPQEELFWRNWGLLPALQSHRYIVP